MKRNLLNFIIDLVSFANLLGLALTGFIIKYILPPGTGGCGRFCRGGCDQAHIKYFWSMTRHEWGDIHFYFAVLFATLMVVHLTLHWNWIKNYIRLLLSPVQK